MKVSLLVIILFWGVVARADEGLQCAQRDIVATLDVHPGLVRHIESVDERVYCLSGINSSPVSSAVVSIIDVRTPESSRVVSEFGVTSLQLEMAVDGTTLYLATDDRLIDVYDVSDPEAPTLQGSFVSEYPVSRLYSIRVVDGVLYAAGSLENERHLLILDVRDPGEIEMIAEVPVPGAEEIHVSGDLAFVAGGADSGLLIFDVSDPAVPVMTGSLEGMYYTARDLRSSGHILCAAMSPGSTRGELKLIDVSDPANAFEVGSIGIPSWPSGMRIANDLAYVVHQSGVEVVDISDPTTPGRVSAYPSRGDAYAMALTPGGTLVYPSVNGTANPVELHVVDTNTLPQPYISSWFETVGGADPMVIEGSVAYVGVAHDDIHMYDIADPDAPVFIGTIAESETRLGDVLFVSDGILFLATQWTAWWRMFDLADPRDPTFIVARQENAQAFGKMGSTLLVGRLGSPTGIQGLYMHSPTSLWPRSMFEMGKVRTLLVSGDLCFASDETSRVVRVIRYINPNQPVQLSEFPIEGVAVAFLLRDQVLYVTDGQKLTAVDVADPSAPEVLSSTPMLGCYDLALKGDHLQVTCGNEGIFVVDVSDPAEHTILAQAHADPWSLRQLEVVGDRVLVSATRGWPSSSNGQLRVYDTADCPNCLADVNTDGTLDLDDISVFVSAFLSADPTADLTGDGVLNFDDLDAFVDSYLSGCA